MEHEPAEAVDRDCPNGDLVVVVLIFWALSLLRVVSAIARHETFGAEATLAALATLFSPVVLKGPSLWLFRRIVDRLAERRRRRANVRRSSPTS